MILNDLYKKGLIHPPSWLPTNTHLLVLTGSVAYGCSSDTSDNDCYGFVIPKKEDLFTHLRGDIPGFGKQKQSFNQWQEHGIIDKDSGKEYDFQIFSITKYFQLCMDNNPNCIDSLFVPENCVIHSTQIGNLMRENRKIFLHKGSWPKFKGYAFSQIKKMKTKTPEEGSNRYEDVQEHGFDLKFSYHLVRLLLEAEQILTLHDLDLQRDREILKSIRRGEWTEQRILDYFDSKEKDLEKIYAESTLPWGPDEEKIKKLLCQCLEEHYGSLDKVLIMPDRYESALREVKEICERYFK